MTLLVATFPVETVSLDSWLRSLKSAWANKLDNQNHLDIDQVLVILIWPSVLKQRAQNRARAVWSPLQRVLSRLYQDLWFFFCSNRHPLKPSIDIYLWDAFGSPSRDQEKWKFLGGITPTVLITGECNDMEKELKQELLLRNAQLKHVSLPPDSLLPGESIHNIADLPTSTAVNDKCWKHYRSVVFGGTFDHLHAGHKILLTMACWLSEERVTCGVSDGPLLINKKFKEQLQSLNERMEKCREFMLWVCNHSLAIEVISIQDSFGPTITVPELDAIVVSDETKSGADKINQIRSERNMAPLDIYSIDLVGSLEDESQTVDSKMSSTGIRAFLADL